MVTETETCQVQLDVFEGPLDLLLHLIRTQELDVRDIPIARVTRQYLDYLQLMRDLNMTVAGEYLVMAATLIHIKSKMLLPEDDSSEPEPEEDPREELVRDLLQYEQFKKAAHLLHEKEIMEQSSWTRGTNEFEEEEKEMVVVDLFDVVRAFHRIVNRYKDRILVEIDRDDVTLEGKIYEIRRLLQVEGEFFFSLFFKRGISRRHLVVALMALLELVRLGEVRLLQKGAFQDIRIVAC